MGSEPFTRIGRVAKTHGLKGEVSVVSSTEAPLSLLVGREVWFVPPPAGTRNATVVSVRSGPKGALLTLSGITGIGVAGVLVGVDLLARTSDLPEQWFAVADEEDDYLGYSVSDGEHGLLGEIVEIIVTGANDVWVVHGPHGEVLIPVIDSVVLEIDDDAGTVEVRLLPGLLASDEEE